jgi:hypothetical protein
MGRCLSRLGCALIRRAGRLFLVLLWVALNGSSQTNSLQAPSTCACPDGRQFSTGWSLFGKNSARVLITGFRRDLIQPFQEGGLPKCKDLMVVGQTIYLEAQGNRPFLRRETQKRGTIEDICHTTIHFATPRKSYEFFADDGTAVTLSDMDEAQAAADPPEEPGRSDESPMTNNDDLTGKDLIRMIPQERVDDPGGSNFDVDDLKEGAYFIVPRRLKAAPVLDDGTGATVSNVANPSRELTVWAGSFGRVEKRAGFRDQPLWEVEILPHSAPLPFSRYLRSLPTAFRKHQPPQRKFVLASSDMVEINHFLDKYSLEWTRFGNESDEARKREFEGTTILPGIYNSGRPALDDNLENARKAGIEHEVHGAAMRLVFNFKDPKLIESRNMLVLDEESRPNMAAPHFFHKQCFVGPYQIQNQPPAVKISASPRFRVVEADLAIFQPRKSAQVPQDYYAVDLRFRLRSDAGGLIPVVCRFPSAAIEVTLLDNAERILSGVFVIAPATR